MIVRFEKKSEKVVLGIVVALAAAVLVAGGVAASRLGFNTAHPSEVR